jgi:hypothetical protein
MDVSDDKCALDSSEPLGSAGVNVSIGDEGSPATNPAQQTGGGKPVGVGACLHSK